MKKNLSSLPIFPITLSLVIGFSQNAMGQNNEDVQGTWNGTVRFVEKYNGRYPLGHSERYIDLIIKDNKVTGTHKYSSESAFGKSGCFGSGEGAIVYLSIRAFDSTYAIEINTPECKGENGGTGGVSISILEQRLKITGGQLDVNDLSGNESKQGDVVGTGTYTTSTSWHLVRSLDVELIIIPECFNKAGRKVNYDDWLPEPGKDEMSKGSYVNLKLKIQSKSGKPLKYTALSFELKLSNTSKEPGITINYPVNPVESQLPDLRFIPKGIKESFDEDQYITITCNDGSTGEVLLGSYDGGGATVLTAEATLVGAIKIKGQLLVSGGDEEIQVPKRIPGTMIATAWRAKNGNPEEMDDAENSKGNSNNGDGLSAYEEYRGVITEGKFKRLDPRKKELGVKVKKAEKSLFAEGIKKFENATSLSVILFDDNEIPADRRLNKNAAHAHVYPQYVLFLQKGVLPSNKNGEAFGGPAIPKQVTQVVIDLNNIHRTFLDDQNEAARMNTPLPYNENELFATIVSHELAHGVNAFHHGSIETIVLNATIIANANPSARIIRHDGREESTRPFLIRGKSGIPGNKQSGDLDCIMIINHFSSWLVDESSDTTIIFYEVPIIPLGSKLCDKKDGTGINSNNKYFGNATMGKCRQQIKLK